MSPPGPAVSDVRMAAGAGARRCWVLLHATPRRDLLVAALATAGWDVESVLSHPLQAGERLDEVPPPDLLVCGLAFDGADALPLIRQLGRMRARTAVFVVSRQQRAVIVAATTLVEVCGLTLAGSAEEPVDAESVLRALDRSQPHAGPTPRNGADVPLGRSDLRQLLAVGGLQAWMQPQLRLDSREITGVEALMRGVTEDGQLITPDRIVPGLMKHALLEEATLHILEQTVRFVARAMETGLALSGSVNVSLRSLSDPAFCRELPRVCALHGLDPSWITLEVTETDAMADLHDVVENSARARMLGFNLAIDDFGTAYSSLSQLMSIPFSELKIDRSFVRGLDRSERRQSIVSACAELGTSLGLYVVAEGVETDQELRAVRACGCTHVQGYRVGRPQPALELLPWLQALPNQVWGPAAPARETPAALPSGAALQALSSLPLPVRT